MTYICLRCGVETNNETPFLVASKYCSHRCYTNASIDGTNTYYNMLMLGLKDNHFLNFMSTDEVVDKDVLIKSLGRKLKDMRYENRKLRTLVNRHSKVIRKLKRIIGRDGNTIRIEMGFIV